jgi:8-oxo-dGTP diphosphatase
VAIARASEGALLVTDLVEAAGGVVLRGAPRDREVLLVHRPRQDDWSVPKGKLDDGETPEEAALREVDEETGWRCVLGPSLPETRYRDAEGRPKRVRYWLMRPRDEGGWRPTAEVDEVRWCATREAGTLVSYDADRAILDAAAAMDEPIYLVRHAKAASRGDWREDDDLRPLTDKGLGQAAGLRAQLGLTDVRRVWSSPSLRCVQTVEPLADELAVPVDRLEALREGTRARRAIDAVRALDGPSVACTHGDVLAAIVESIPAAGRTGAAGWKKGATWVLDRDGGDLVGARYVPPPGDGEG